MAIAILTTECLFLPNGQAAEFNLNPDTKRQHRGETPAKQQEESNRKIDFSPLDEEENWRQEISRQERVCQWQDAL